MTTQIFLSNGTSDGIDVTVTDAGQTISHFELRPYILADDDKPTHQAIADWPTSSMITLTQGSYTRQLSVSALTSLGKDKVAIVNFVNRFIAANPVHVPIDERVVGNWIYMQMSDFEAYTRAQNGGMTKTIGQDSVNMYSIPTDSPEMPNSGTTPLPPISAQFWVILLIIIFLIIAVIVGIAMTYE